ncbi:MAG: hypothetical protein E6344_07440 [Clostridium sp.]|nr:hypothetical protein [Clostridium sp.]MDU7083510.1 hypothetical protein [Clostridium sp.]
MAEATISALTSLRVSINGMSEALIDSDNVFEVNRANSINGSMHVFISITEIDSLMIALIAVILSP